MMEGNWDYYNQEPPLDYSRIKTTATSTFVEEKKEPEEPESKYSKQRKSNIAKLFWYRYMQTGELPFTSRVLS
jgi:hypothetical protein